MFLPYVLIFVEWVNEEEVIEFHASQKGSMD